MAGAVALYAHAVLVKSQPAPNANLKRPSFPVLLTFNSRVDQVRSTLTLEGPAKTKFPLAVKRDSDAPEKLGSAVSGAKPGTYMLRWQVLSIDGHITQGQIRFEVQ